MIRKPGDTAVGANGSGKSSLIRRVEFAYGTASRTWERQAVENCRSGFPGSIRGGDTVAKLDILSPEFTREAEAAWDRARNQALVRGVSVFYRNDASGIEIMEQPDGRLFEIRFIPGSPRGQNFEIIRELARSAA